MMNKLKNCVVLCLPLLCSSLSAQSIKMYNPDNGQELNGTSTPNKIRFDIVELGPPSDDPNLTPPPSWGYLWDFGDCSTPSTEKSPTHHYVDQSDTYTVTLTLTPKYSDDDELPVHDTTFTVNGPYSVPPSPEIYQFDPGKKIDIVAIRDCKPGNLNTFLVPYENTSGSSIANGMVKFEYNSDEMDFDGTYLNGCGYDPPYAHSAANGKGTITFKFSDLADGEQSLIPVTLLTKSNASLGEEILFTAKLFSDTIDSIYWLMSKDSLEMEVVNSHDPNDKRVSRKRVCNTDSLIYTINFENKGTADAEWIYIIDDMDPHLDMNSFRMVSTSHFAMPSAIDDGVAIDATFNPYFLNFLPNEDLKILRDTANRKMAFVFKDIDLPPSSTGTNMVEDLGHGHGRVKYAVQLDAAVPFNQGKSFGSHADIHFDYNDPIATNVPLARKALCYCRPTGNNSSMEWIDRIAVSDLDNSSGNNRGYKNYNHLSATLTEGLSYGLTLDPGFKNGNATTQYWHVFIDLNQDGTFSPAEKMYGGNSSATISTSISIPTAAFHGETRMRVVMSDNASTPLCGSNINGEVEDYAIYILDPNLPDVSIITQSVNRQRVAEGTTLSLTTELTNTGPASLNAGTKVDYYLSRRPAMNGNAVYLSQQTLRSLSEGAFTTMNASLALPMGLTGRFYLLTVVDHQQLVMENDEENNFGILPLFIGDLKPDLAIGRTAACKRKYMPGQQITISCVVKNQGLATAWNNSSSHLLKLCLSTDRKPDANDWLLDSLSLDSIQADSTLIITAVGQIPSNVATGTLYLIAHVDANDNIGESFESNNIGFTKIQVVSTPRAQVPYYTGFECNDMDAFWTVDNNASTRARVCSQHQPFKDLRHLFVEPQGRESDIKSDLHIDLSGDSAYLTFKWKDLAPQRRSSADGLYFSDNGGRSFTKVFTLADRDSMWNSTGLCIRTIADQYGLTPSNDFVIRFRHKESNSNASRGLTIDEVAVSHEPLALARRKGEVALSDEVTDPKMQVYPNPFKGQTTIRYHLNEDDTEVSIMVFNLAGQLMLQPLNGVNQNSGTHTMDLSSASLGAGIYLCVLKTPYSVDKTRLIIYE